MRNSYLRSFAAIACIASFLASCKSEPEPVHDKGPVVMDDGRTVVRNGIVYNVAELAYPTGDKSTSALWIRQLSPAELRAGQEYDYYIDVTNLTKADLQNVEVRAEHFNNLSYVSSAPNFSKSDDDLVWRLGDMPAGSTKTINIKGKAPAVGASTSCLTASYANVLCLSSNVVQPALKLVKTATPEICGTCDDVRLTYEVTNSGTGMAEKTVITDTLPAGLTTADGKSSVEINAGDIPAGKSKPFTVMAKATKTGSFSSAASANASGLKAQSESPTTVVKQPALSVTCDASNRVFVGRDVNYKLTVKNSGTCPASGAVVSATVPSGASFVSADNNGHADRGKVVWNVASIPAGQSMTLSMKLRAGGIGSMPLAASAQAVCVPPVGANCATDVAGIPAILLEVVDLTDPVEVGTTTTFVVTATNQGSSADTNVQVTGTLPPEMEFVSGTGSSAVTANGQTIQMAAVPSVAPKAKAEWRLGGIL